MYIREFRVKKLFGHYNYRIEFHDSITILHGPNGSGKTTVLKILNAIFALPKNTEQRFDLRENDFSEASVVFSDSTELYIEKKLFKLFQKEESGFTYFAYKIKKAGETVPTEYDPMAKFQDKKLSDDFELNSIVHTRDIPYIERVDINKWYDRKNGVLLDTEELVYRYGTRVLRRYGGFVEVIPDEVKNLLVKVKVRFISSDRLMVEKKTKEGYQEKTTIEKRVNEIAGEIAKRIDTITKDYAKRTEAMDRTYPYRVIRNSGNVLTIEEIKEKIENLERKRQLLAENGLLVENDEMNISELLDEIKDENRLNLSIYVQDTEKKLSVYDKFSEYISLFRELIDSNFSNKEMVFDSKKGFYFVTKYSNTRIAPDKLSSGEQQELVMFYQLIFETDKNTLVLIDEPELSLHIKWQLDYIEQLKRIIGITGCTCLMATHSPQIINGNWNMTMALTHEG